MLPPPFLYLTSFPLCCLLLPGPGALWHMGHSYPPFSETLGLPRQNLHNTAAKSLHFCGYIGLFFPASYHPPDRALPSYTPVGHSLTLGLMIPSLLHCSHHHSLRALNDPDLWPHLVPSLSWSRSPLAIQPRLQDMSPHTFSSQDPPCCHSPAFFPVRQTKPNLCQSNHLLSSLLVKITQKCRLAP